MSVGKRHRFAHAGLVQHRGNIGGIGFNQVFQRQQQAIRHAQLNDVGSGKRPARQYMRIIIAHQQRIQTLPGDLVWIKLKIHMYARHLLQDGIHDFFLRGAIIVHQYFKADGFINDRQPRRCNLRQRNRPAQQRQHKQACKQFFHDLHSFSVRLLQRSSLDRTEHYALDQMFLYEGIRDQHRQAG